MIPENTLAPNFGDECIVKVLYDNKAIPAIRNDLARVLIQAGVNNVELFPARITNPITGVIYEDYQSFNVLGLIAAADLEASRLMDPDAEPSVLDTDFESLVIDEGRTHGSHLFRLAENCSVICVSEQVKLAVEDSQIPGLKFMALGNARTKDRLLSLIKNAHY